MKKWLPAVLLVVLLFPTEVSAHSFGKLYNLPVPFWMYLYAAGAALLLSFLIIGYLFGKSSLDKSNFKLIKVKNSWISNILKTVSLSFFILSILTGIFGVDFSYLNFNMSYFWVIFVLGLTYLSGILGNIYQILNPWMVLVGIGEYFSNQEFVGITKYKKSLGYLPAFLFYFIFIWVELFGATIPSTLSRILIQYTIINFLGVFLIGKESWFKYAEFFSVFFGLIGKLAPYEIQTNKNKIESLKIRKPIVGLVDTNLENFSLLLFILLMLSSTAYDGIKDTIFWYQFSWANIRDFFPVELRSMLFTTTQSLYLLLSPFIFFLIYFIFIFLMKLISKTKLPLKTLLLSFGYSLIPIAFVYNFAHYYTLLLTEGQNFIRIISDPFGFGWNLFGTTNYYSNLSVVDVGITWHVQVVVILLGHIVSVYVAHLIGLRLFKDQKTTLISQIPILFLMIIYTVLGLWILSQPLTGGAL